MWPELRNVPRSRYRAVPSGADTIAVDSTAALERNAARAAQLSQYYINVHKAGFNLRKRNKKRSKTQGNTRHCFTNERNVTMRTVLCLTPKTCEDNNNLAVQILPVAGCITTLSRLQRIA